MTSTLLAAVSIAASYLIGSVPFAYLTVYWARGIDIRTVGSGNVGATNVGRVLGFRYFVFVFVLDVLKGLLPTYWLPQLVAEASGAAVPDLRVLVALATILGHNFPAFLRFRGGKGVATSLGALLALDATTSLLMAGSFVVFFVVTKIVSISSVSAALVFVLVHFYRVDHPWQRDQVAMSLLTIGLLGMLIVRHRKNFARIAAGTEPKVSFRKRRPAPPGRATPLVVAALALMSVVGGLFAANASRTLEVPLGVGPFRLVEVARASTNHQRAERLTFADNGRLLAVTCPRYNRVVLYRVAEGQTLELLHDLELKAKPVALWATKDRLYILQRPSGDARHVEEAYWETFDFQGGPVGERFRVGFDPDDLVITRDERHALVLTSGYAEGETNRPAPALAVVDLTSKIPKTLARLNFERAGDDPERITLSTNETHAAVKLWGSNQVVGISLADWTNPVVTGRLPLPTLDRPYRSQTDQDSIMMPVASDRELVRVHLDWSLADNPSLTFAGSCEISTMPDQSALEVHGRNPDHPLGRLPLLGAGNLGGVRPMGLAYDAGRQLLAVATRSGGVHLVAIRRLDESGR
ncbi:MAG: glycerol-3-phosphate 1-O-acyltransferase PlsY [Isosphaeraceae bacterium]